MSETPLDRRDEAYDEIRRIIDAHSQVHPGAGDRWNGDVLRAEHSSIGEGAILKDGTLRVSNDSVASLGRANRDRDPTVDRARGTEYRGFEGSTSLALIIHESLHAASDHPEAPLTEPDLTRHNRETELDEGLTELITEDEFDDVAAKLGAPEARYQPTLYTCPKHGAQTALELCAPDRDRREVARELYEKPQGERFDTLANMAIDSQLSDVVPNDPANRDAVVAYLAGSLAGDKWHLSRRNADSHEIGDQVKDNFHTAINEVREHYAKDPKTPFVAPERAPDELQSGSDQGTGERARGFQAVPKAANPDLTAGQTAAHDASLAGIAAARGASTVPSAAEMGNAGQQFQQRVRAAVRTAPAPEVDLDD